MAKQKRSVWIKFLIIILIILGIIGVGGYLYLQSKLNKIEKVEINESDLGINEEIDLDYPGSDKIKNIALFGIDAEEGESGRSDSIIIATIDPVHEKLKLTSIMRDSYVDIPGYGMDKINHAYAFGGPQLAMKTLNENFGLNITDFVSVNFSSLPIIIDAVGGVEITITEEEAPHIPGISGSGTYTLTGDQTLSYSRIRYAEGGDYKRTERQRTILEALFKKSLSLPPTSYMRILDTILPHVQTNMSSNTILSMGAKVLTSFNGVLEQQRFPLDGYAEDSIIDGIYYLTFDLATVRQQLLDYIFEDKLEITTN